MESGSRKSTWSKRLPPQLRRIADLPRAKKLMLFGGTFAILAIIAAILLWNRGPQYAVLFSNLEDKDGGEIVNVLTTMNVPYEITADGKAILVPEDQVHEVRMSLATQGYPKSGSVGFELMDNQRIGISQFAEQVNYQRALEGELSSTIQSLSIVKNAQVHVAIPKPSVFIRDNQKPTASVVVSLQPGRVLSESQIAGITHLISSSVPNMPNDAVRIVDQNGVLLNPEQTGDNHLGLNGKQLAYVRMQEEEMVKRIESILAPTSGPENVRAQVSLDIDFAKVEQTEEIFKPNSDPNAKAIRSEQGLDSAKPVIPIGGVPGAFSNQPPQPPQAPIATDNAPPPVTGQPGGSPAPAENVLGGTQQIPMEYRKEGIRNFEVDKKVIHIQQASGNNIRRLTVAVILNNKKVIDKDGNVISSPYTADELTKITDLVRQTVGLDPKRGDTITVTNMEFDPETFGKDVPFWEQPEKMALLQLLLENLFKYLIVLGLALYLIFGVIRPILKPPAPPAEEPLSLAGLGQSPYVVRLRLDETEEGGETGEVAPVTDVLVAEEPPEGGLQEQLVVEEPQVTVEEETPVVEEEPVEEPEEEGEELEEEEEEIEEEVEDELPPPDEEEEEIETSSGIDEFLVRKPTYQTDLDFSRELALAEPKMVAKVIRDWMNPQS